MIRVKKISPVFLSVVIFISTTLIIASTKFVIASSEEKNNAIEIKINRGDPAPDFTLENMSGERVSLKDFRGIILVLGIVFGEKPARDMEKYRRAVLSDIKRKGVKFLKVAQINKPAFIGKNFIRKKMMKQFKDIPGAPQNTLIDWGGSQKLNEKYVIEDKDSPALFIVGREGKIMCAFQGWHNEKNMNRLKNEIFNILKGQAP